MSTSLTAIQIETCLHVLDDYERSLLRGIHTGEWDEGDRTDRELMRIAAARAGLQKLKEEKVS